MANTARKAASALTVSATLLAASPAPAADRPSRPSIVVHVVDHAGLRPADLARATRHAALVYDQAGVRTMWVHGTEVPAQIPGALYLTVLILSREMGERKIAADGVGAGVLGRAARPSGRAHIFPHRIADVAARHGLDFGGVLGHVIAHEVGHLVLPVHSHSKSGIMGATIDLRGDAGDRRSARFTDEQAAAIRTTVASAN